MDDPMPSPYALLFEALWLIPIRHYLYALILIWTVFFYKFVEFHFLGEYFRGRVNLIYNPDSPIYHGVVSRCRTLHSRYVATPWLASPHLQTCFLNFHGLPPVFTYTRKLFRASDGGTIALDWLTNSHVVDGDPHNQKEISKEDTTPIAVVIPGLTSDSSSAYLKHLAYNTAKSGWNVVVSNHRGLGGVSVTSDCFYNAGWTEDVRVVLDHLQHEFPMAPLFAIGTSIGANILVKYLGEEGEKTPLRGAVAICSPWDLLVYLPKIQTKVVRQSSNHRTSRLCPIVCPHLIGLSTAYIFEFVTTLRRSGYSYNSSFNCRHEPQYTRLANWEGIKKSRSIRDFDNHATCHVGKFETVDTFYRKSSSTQYVGNVAVPLLCISALDDPLCTKEAIPWEECRANKNIVLATTNHGGHLAFFEGLTASSLWWVRATNEFLGALSCSRYMHIQKIQESGSSGSGKQDETSINQGPYLNIAEDGLVAAANLEENTTRSKEATLVLNQRGPKVKDKRSFNVLCRQTKRSIWLLGYIGMVTGFPLVGMLMNYLFRKKQRPITASKS
ncbi:embryogenesis-associated protein EMB8 isoform X2 [Brassica napus]|uniref:embryogenesis-associated protein EMB8 isoform X2 n=1 Tax=Brassica napus TaxID=3708 RepID=UPI002079524E|nr:embryogenesis-associated protein EMB8 isoform X2 [Brassica napus]